MATSSSPRSATPLPPPPPAVHLVAGGLGGMAGAIVTAPLDVIKTRLQSDLFARAPHPHTPPRGPVASLIYPFVDTARILRDVYKYEGPSALFKGLGPTLAGAVPARSINFFVYGNGKLLYADWFNHGRENTAVHLAAAATAGIVTAAATNPIWVIKTDMQLRQQERQATRPPSSSPFPSSSSSSSSSSASSADAAPRRPLPPPPPPPAKPPHPVFSHSFRALSSPPTALSPPPQRPTSYSTAVQILRTQGPRGFYRGLSASLLGVTEGTLQWSLYEQFKRMARVDAPGTGGGSGASAGENSGPSWRVSAAAGGAKLVATVITYPHEVVRTRLRQPIPPGGTPKYTALVQTFRLVLREEGARALYGGMSAHLLRVIPNAAAMFSVYELLLSLAARSAQAKRRVDVENDLVVRE